MKNYNGIKAALLAAILSAGAYACLTMKQNITAALKEVNTINMSRTAFHRSVSGKGSIFSDGEKWFVSAAVEECDISEVAVGQQADVSSAAVAERLSGTVSSVADTAHSENGKTYIEVMIQLDDTTETLRNGYTAKSYIYTDDAKIINTLPYEVIRQDENGEYVYICDGNKAVKCSIVTGIELSGETEVIRGITEKSDVISEPDGVTENELIRKETKE